MDLRNNLPHMVGKFVLVNGTRYKIDEEGVAKKIKDKDAVKLLLNKAVWGPVRSPAKGGKGKGAPSKDADSKDADTTSDGDTITADGAKEWPEPTVEMDHEYLREMAAAYDVSTTHNMKPETMVTRIKEARDLE